MRHTQKCKLVITHTSGFPAICISNKEDKLGMSIQKRNQQELGLFRYDTQHCLYRWRPNRSTIKTAPSLPASSPAPCSSRNPSCGNPRPSLPYEIHTKSSGRRGNHPVPSDISCSCPFSLLPITNHTPATQIEPNSVNNNDIEKKKHRPEAVMEETQTEHHDVQNRQEEQTRRINLRNKTEIEKSQHNSTTDGNYQKVQADYTVQAGHSA